MKNSVIVFFILSAAIMLSSCATMQKKSVAYKGFYDQNPVTVLIMPPINKSTEVDAKEYFYSTLNMPIANDGYYVLPPFLSMEILKKESAYDSEMFMDAPLSKFGNYFGADIVLFTIIHSWKKSVIFKNVTVEIEYIFKSVKTNEVIYQRRGTVVYDTSVSAGGGFAGMLISSVASAVKTATTQYVTVAVQCNNYTLVDVPAGKYSPKHGNDGDTDAGPKVFEVSVK